MSEIQAKESTITLNRLFFDESAYYCRKDDVKETNLEVNFTREISKTGEHAYRVSLRCIAKNKDESVELRVRVVGLFSFDGEGKEQEKALISRNTMAILFPYLRSQIALMTAQTDSPKFVLPPMNISEMFPVVDLPE